jgi:NACalpha-BTF3-like transcription factor
VEVNAGVAYNKGSILKQMSELAVSNLVEDSGEQGPKIFKILANCMEHNRPVKQVKSDKVEPNAKYLKILLEDFKFSEEEATQALIETNNDSVDEAVGYIAQLKNAGKVRKEKWMCPICTLVNVISDSVCDACGQEFIPGSEVVE